MGKVIYLEDYFKQNAAKAACSVPNSAKDFEKYIKENVQSVQNVQKVEPTFIEYPVDSWKDDFSFFVDADMMDAPDIDYMKETNREIPLWFRKFVNGVTKYFYPNMGEDRRFYIWELRKDIYDFFGYTWYSPADMHPGKYLD